MAVAAAAETVPGVTPTAAVGAPAAPAAGTPRPANQGRRETTTTPVAPALVGVRRGSTTVPVICVELDRSKRGVRDPAALLGELTLLAQAHEHTRPIRHFLIHPAFPVDIRHNAKIFREKLAVWAGRRLERRCQDWSEDDF